jgi:uncharacterized protein (DUF1800 family)
MHGARNVEVETTRRHGRRRHRRRRRAAARRHARTPVYHGRFGPEQAERLLWRAGFGPRPGDAEKLAKKGLTEAVRSLTHPPKERLSGPAPHDSDGRPLAPADAWGHDHLWWLDRMVRSNRPLVERMTLVWHDWFATSNDGVGAQRLMLHQNALLRKHALGSFAKLLVGVTRDPAMLLWLSGSENTKESPNENYGRELMELFTLGADRGYTETDVREQARALTGFQNDWDDGVGPNNFHFDSEYHDTGVKKILGKRGRFDWRDSCRLCLEHRKHPSFFVTKLWSYFVPTEPGRKTRRALERLYVEGRYEVRPLVEAILRHPVLYEGPRMVKPPAVYVAGLLRGMARGVDTDSWTWLGHLMGQQLFYPPNVAGWDDARWLDSGTWRGRWIAAVEAVKERQVDPKSGYDVAEDPETAVDRALAFWGRPAISGQTRAALVAFARRCEAAANQNWKKRSYPILRQNALRVLVATSPDLQTG